MSARKPIKASTAIIRGLKSYTANDFFCGVLEDSYAETQDEGYILAKAELDKVLHGHGCNTLNMYLSDTLEVYRKARESGHSIHGEKCYQMRALWLETFAGQLKKAGK